MSALDKAVSRNSQNLAEQQLIENMTVRLERSTAGKMFAVENDCGMIVAWGLNTNLALLKSLLPTIYTSRIVSDVLELLKKSDLAIGRPLVENGTQTLCILLRELSIEKDETSRWLATEKLLFSFSVYSRSCYTNTWIHDRWVWNCHTV